MPSTLAEKQNFYITAYDWRQAMFTKITQINMFETKVNLNQLHPCKKFVA
jgi:hypothetical protein